MVGNSVSCRQTEQTRKSTSIPSGSCRLLFYPDFSLTGKVFAPAELDMNISNIPIVTCNQNVQLQSSIKSTISGAFNENMRKNSLAHPVEGKSAFN